MAKLTGNQGSVTCTSVGWGTGVVVASIYEWTADIDEGEKDVTAFGSGGFYEGISTGNKKLGGTLKMFADDTTALVLATSTNPSLVLIMHGSDRKLTGSAVLRNMKLGANGKTSDPQEVSFDFYYSGSFTIV